MSFLLYYSKNNINIILYNIENFKDNYFLSEYYENNKICYLIKNYSTNNDNSYIQREDIIKKYFINDNNRINFIDLSRLI